MTAVITPPSTTDADPDAGASVSTPTPPARRGSPRAIRPIVTAVLVVRNGTRWLPETLHALAVQTRPPERLLVLDLGSTDGSSALIEAHAGVRSAIAERELRSLSGSDSLASAVGAALADLAPPTPPPAAGPLAPPGGEHEEWLWLLHDDSAPMPDALRRLVDAVRRSPSVGMAGPKIMEWDRPRHLLEVGHQLTRAGRRVQAPRPGEPDQGQFDTRTDVLAVGTPGMLVRRALFEAIGGFDPALPVGAQSLDLGWRAQLAGERVVVVPAAKIREAGAPFAGDRVDRRHTLSARRAERSAVRRVALARCSIWAAPLLALWLVISAIGSAVGLLLLKRPAHAWVELGDLGALAHPWSSIRSRWRFRGRRTVRRRDLSTVFVTTGAAARHALDRVAEALTPERRRDDAPLATAIESGPVSEEAEDLTVLPASLPQRFISNPGVLATVVAGAAAAAGFLTSLRAGLLDARYANLAGGQLQRVSADSSGLWHGYRDGWHGAGLGSDLPNEPSMAVLSLLTWLAERLPYVGDGRSPASVMLAWVLLFGMPLAAASAYLAGRVLTTARWPRGLAALAWGCSGVLAAAVSQGRVTAVLAHIVLPLVAAGLIRATTSGGTFTSAAATALGAGVLGMLAPVLLVAVLVGGFLLVLAGPGLRARAHALAVLVLAVALQGPGVARLTDPAALLGSAGLLADPESAQAPVWQLLTGTAELAGTSALVCALLLVAVVLAAGLALVRSPIGRRARLGVVAAVLLTALGGSFAALAGRLPVGEVADPDTGALAAATAWTGPGVQVGLLCLLGLALAGSVGMRTVIGRSGWGPRRILAGIALTLLGLGLLGNAAALGMSGLDDTLRAGSSTAPAVAIDQARGPEATRLLVLSAAPDRIDYEIVSAEPARLLRSLHRPVSVTDPGFAEIVTALAAGPDLGQSERAAGDLLADLGVGFVSVRAEGEHPLLRTLDATPGLTRLGTTDGQTLWRVQVRPAADGSADPVAPARLRLVSADGRPLVWLPSQGPHARTVTTVPAGAAQRLLVVAESPDWAAHAQVRLNGLALEPVAASAGQTPTYRIPPGGGLLTIDVPPADPRWFTVHALILALVIFLAIPFGNRRSRSLR